MKIQVNSKILADTIAVVRKAQAAKNAIPIHDKVLFSVRGEELTLACSDGELFLVARIPLVESDGDFAFAVPPADLAPLKSIADQPITIECSVFENGTMACTINYLNGHFTSYAEPGDEFPRPVSFTTEPQRNTIPLMYMLDGIRHTKFAALDGPQAELKPQMAGVYFDMQPYGMISVACNGGRLAKVWYKDVHVDQPFGFVMINKAVKAMTDVLSKVSDVENVELAYTDHNFRIDAGNYTLYGILPEQKYPNYNSVIPENPPLDAVISRQDLIGALSRVGIFSEMSNLVVLHFSKSNLTIESEDTVFSRSAKENVMCEYNAEPIAVAVEYRFLMEILNTMAGEDMVSVRLTDAQHAITLTPSEADEEQSLLYLLMPMMPGMAQ